MASAYFTTILEMKAPVEVAAAAGNYTSYKVSVELEASAGHYQQKEQEDASNYKEQESVANDQSLQDDYQKVESVTEGDVVYGQQEERFTQVESRNVKRDYGQRGSYQNQRDRRGSQRGGGGYPNGRRGRGGGGGYQNGRYESYDQSRGNGYQRNYYNNRGRRRGGGGGNGHSYNNHQDSNVTAAS